MRPMLLRRLAATSVAILCLFAAVHARASRRPHYGGTLRVEMGTPVMSVDPGESSSSSEETLARSEIYSLIYSPAYAPSYTNPEPNAGSGPFKISSWQPGKLLTLQANEKFREGRPYVDVIEISMGRAAGDRILDLELNKADLARIPAQDARHAAERGVRTSQSQPDELLAIVFLEPRTAKAVGQALSLSIDRVSIVNFLLQKTGEPSGALLPQWSSGTSFLFATSADVPRAKELWSQITPSRHIVLGYDFADPLEQSVAERIVVNAKEADIAVNAVPIGGNKSTKADARLVRAPMSESKPGPALNSLLQTFDALGGNAFKMKALSDSASSQEIYDREREVLDDFRIVPVVWLPQVYGLSKRVRNWNAPLPGKNWALAEVWLDTDEKSADIKDSE